METSKKVIHMKLAGAELIVGPGARLPDGLCIFKPKIQIWGNF
jgi:hypothetical protein